MAKFHIREDGTPGPCSASVRSCPRGGKDDHFDSIVEAAQAIEARNKEQELPATVSKMSRVERENLVVRSLNLPHSMEEELLAYRDELEPELTKLVETTEEADPLSTSTPSRLAKYTARAAQYDLVARWLSKSNAIEDLPQAVQDRVWDKSWADGHSSGYSEVSNYYTENADFARAVFEAGRATR